MNFTETEFSTVTDKLERYASQLGTLQAHLETQKELNGMMATLGDKERELAELKYELEMERASRQKAEEAAASKDMEIQTLKTDRDLWMKECEKMNDVIKNAAVENAFLKNYIILSMSSIKQFFRFIKRLDTKAVLHAFLMKTVSPEMGPGALEMINEVVDLEEITDGKLADQIIIDNSGLIAHE